MDNVVYSHEIFFRDRPDAVADIEGGNILELARWNTVATVQGLQLHVPEVTLALQLISC